MTVLDGTKKDKNRLITNACIIPFCGELASLIGRPSTLILQQLHYWLTTEGEHIGKVVDGKRWIYNTYEDWCKELKHYCSRTIRSSIKKLEDLDIVSSRKFHAYQGDQTKWYTINYDVLQQLFPTLFSQSNTVIHIKNTQENLISPYSSSGGKNFPLFIKNQKDTNISSIPSKNTLSKKLIGKLKAKGRKENKLAKNDSKLPKTQTTESNLTDVNKLNLAMKQTWERVVEGSNNSIYLTKRLCKFFMAAFHKKFNNSLEQWEAFCRKITTSDFLMGQSSSPFKASLEWALRFDVIDKILKGCYGVKELKQGPPPQTQERLQSLEEQIYSSSENDRIKSFRKSLLAAVGVNTYTSWFKNITICELNNTLNITAENRFKTDHIYTHFAQIITKLITFEKYVAI